MTVTAEHVGKGRFHGRGRSRLAPSPEEREEIIRRFLKKIQVSAAGCWEWTGALDPDGYGRFRYRNRSALAHRVAWELIYGEPVPEVLDHRCPDPTGRREKNRRCCNVRSREHLLPSTVVQNTLTGETVTGGNLRKTHCARGHPFDRTNTASRGGKRSCRTCRRNRKLRSEAKGG